MAEIKPHRQFNFVFSDLRLTFFVHLKGDNFLVLLSSDAVENPTPALPHLAVPSDLKTLPVLSNLSVQVTHGDIPCVCESADGELRGWGDRWLSPGIQAGQQCVAVGHQWGGVDHGNLLSIYWGKKNHL